MLLLLKAILDKKKFMTAHLVKVDKKSRMKFISLYLGHLKIIFSRYRYTIK